MRKIFFLITILILFFAQSTFAQSPYVLPYPSSMPGNFLYKPHLILEQLMKFWYFGNFGQFEYNLKESDKYLVEAKILFEYNQFLYASASLEKSDNYFKQTLPFLILAQKQGKDITGKRKMLSDAAAKHIEVLNKLSKELPDQFEWKPEKDKPTTIFIKKDIDNSISVRQNFL